jgi:CRISPR-associated protein Cas2
LTLIVLARVTPGLRGKLTRWMLEIHPGVFVGKLSPRVRDKLWKAVQAARRLGACTLVFHAPNEQGFVLATAGDPTRTLADFDGLLLLRRPSTDADKPIVVGGTGH